MTKEAKNFIERNSDLIENQDWAQLFSNWVDSVKAPFSYFLKILNKADISDPLIAAAMDDKKANLMDEMGDILVAHHLIVLMKERSDKILDIADLIGLDMYEIKELTPSSPLTAGYIVAFKNTPLLDIISNLRHKFKIPPGEEIKGKNFIKIN